MKKDAVSAGKQEEMAAMDALFAQLVLDEALYQFRKKQLQEKIDRSLEMGDKETFLRLAKEFKEIS